MFILMKSNCKHYQNNWELRFSQKKIHAALSSLSSIQKIKSVVRSLPWENKHISFIIKSFQTKKCVISGEDEFIFTLVSKMNVHHARNTDELSKSFDSHFVCYFPNKWNAIFRLYFLLKKNDFRLSEKNHRDKIFFFLVWFMDWCEEKVNNVHVNLFYIMF